MTLSEDKKLSVSVVIVARNEEKNLPDCLESCKFAKEIVLVDDSSTDRTVEIAKSYGAKVFHRAMNGHWGDQQTFAINQATQPWLFLIDCDERVSDELADNIRKAIESGKDIVYEVQRRNHFKHFTAQHGPLRSDWVPRLFPNEGVRVEGAVHPSFVYSQPLKKLKGRLEHFPYPTIDNYYRKMSHYSALSSDKYFAAGKKSSFFMDIVVRPAWGAFKVYFLNGGFKDGKMGFFFAANHYAYTLQKYCRYYCKKHFGDEL